MRRKARFLGVCLVTAMLVNACSRSPRYLAPIVGAWSYDSAQKQRWVWEFPNDKTVRFSVDDQKQKWSIKSIRVRGLVVEIDVDGFLGRGQDESSTIKIEILDQNSILVSSGLHPGLPFERVDE